MLMLFKSLQIFSGILAVLAFLVLYGFTDGLEGFIKLFTNLDLLIDIASEYPTLIIYISTFIISLIMFFVFKKLHYNKKQEMKNL